MEAINAVSCIKGEIHSIVTLMRLNTRWSQQSRATDGIPTGGNDENPIIKSFRKLNEYLEGMFDLREVDCVMYLSPFHQIIISEKASGVLTSASLSSVSKFVTYGFLSPHFPRAQEGIALIASCISHCVFEESDWESDEVILMKLLELSTLCLRCDASRLLNVRTAWEIYSTCISVQSQYRASKILRSEAETALRNLTLSTFSRAHTALKVYNQRTGDGAVEPFMNPDEGTDFGFFVNVRGNSWETLSESYDFEGPVGVTLLLGKIMNAFSSLMDSSSRTADGVKFALTLVNIALEAGGPALGNVAPLVDVLRGDVCRHLLRASQSDDLAVFSLALRVVFNLFVSIKDHMKVQLEVFLTSVHLRLLTPSQHPQINGKGTKSSSYTASLAKEELALESLLEFCREPSLMEDLYTNYDCDVQCTNLFDSIISVLCIRAEPTDPTRLNGSVKKVPGAVPKGGGHHFEPPTLNITATANGGIRVSILNKLALDGVFAVLHSIAVKCEKTHKSKKPFRTFTNQLKAEAESTTIPIETEFKELSGKSASTVTSLNPKGDTGELAGELVDQWCQIEDSEGLRGGDISRSAVNSAMTVENDGNGVESASTTAMSSPSRAPIPVLESNGTISSLTTAALTAHSSSGNASSSSGHMPSSRLPFTLSMTSHSNGNSNADSTPLMSQLILRDANASPFSANTSADGRIDIISSGDDDADFLHLARAKTAEILRQRKLKKQRLRLASEKFNEKPHKADWMHFALSLGLLRPAIASDRGQTQTLGQGQSVDSKKNEEREKPKTVDPFAFADPDSVAKFLRFTPGLGKTQVGEFLSKGPKEVHPYNAEVMRLYVQTFDFGAGSKCSFDKALRTFLGSFRLPGEAQCIDRLMEAFASKLFMDLGVGNPFASGDAAFILAFSTIMLNTDLHNPNLPQAKRMTKEQFLRNNKGINDGKDLPSEYLENLYEDIKSDQIKMDIDISDLSGAAMMFTDGDLWNKMLRKSALDQVPAAFTPTMSARLNAMAKNHGRGANLYPAGAHEKDMFVATAAPLLRAILAVWEVTDDDQMIRRITESLWVYASVCIGLNLKSILNTLVATLSSGVLLSLAKSRSAPTQLQAIDYPANEVYNARIVNLTNLLNLNFESLIASTSREGEHCVPGDDSSYTPGSGSGTGSVDEVKMNWRETHRLRGEVMMRLVFHIASRCTSSLSAESWKSITQLLLYVRSRGVLPVQLASLALDFKNPLGGAFQFHPSSRALDCHFAARGAPRNLNSDELKVEEEEYGPSFLWGSVYNVASLGGILFQNKQDALMDVDRDRDYSSDETLDANSCPFSTRNASMSEESDFLKAAHTAGIRNVGYAYDNLLRISIQASDVATLLFRCTADIDSIEFTSIVTTQLSILRDLVECLLSSRVVSNAIISRTHPQYKQYSEALSAAGNKELEAVVLLGWISRIITANRSRVHLVWPSMHAFYREIIEDKVDAASVKCPYFLEHSIIMILKLVSLISATVSDDNSGKKNDPVPLVSGSQTQGSAFHTDTESSAFTPFRDPPKSKNEVQGPWAPIPWGMQGVQASPVVVCPSAMHSGLQSVWLSLRLIRGVPNEVLTSLADRLGAGVIGILSSHGQGCSGINTLEQWYLIFSFLSIAATAPTGRPYAWEAIRYLLGTNAINDMNFTPCRHLVLRFLQGSFPADDSNEGTMDLRPKIKMSPPVTGDPDMHARQMESFDHLIDLLALAFGGYKSPLGTRIKKGDSLEGVPQHTIATLSIPILSNPTGDMAGIQIQIPLTASEPQRKMSPNPRVLGPVKFAKAQEVELLWLETIKVFADVSSNDHEAIANKAISYLQKIFELGRSASLPDTSWSKAVGEMLTRLPLGIIQLPKLFAGGDVQAAARCMKCCQIVCDVFVGNMMQLHSSPDFTAYWCKFSSILASNAGAVDRGSDLYAQSIIMIDSLFQLLKPTPIYRSSPRKLQHADATAQTAAPRIVQAPLPVASTPVPAPSLFGRFSFWGAAAPVPAPTPPLILDSATGPTDTARTETPTGGGADELDEVVLEQVKVEHDGGLLGLSWKNMLSITPSISAALKARNQDLQVDLNRCSEHPESAYGLPLYTSTSQNEGPVNTVSTGAFFNSTGRNTQVADILAKKQIPSVPHISATSVPTMVSLSSDLKGSEDEISSYKMSIPSSFAPPTIEDPVSPVVQLGHFSNGDRIHRRSYAPSPVPDLSIEVEGVSSSSATLIGQNNQREGGMIQQDSDPKSMESSRKVVDINAEPVIERMSRTPLSPDIERAKAGFAPIEDYSTGKGTLVPAGSPDACAVTATRDASVHISDVSTPSSTTQPLSALLPVQVEISSPSSSSLSTSEDNYILIKPTIRAASRKISDYVQIV